MKKIYLTLILFTLSYHSFSQITLNFITTSVKKKIEQIAEPLTEQGFQVTGYGKIFSKYNSKKVVIYQVMYWGEVDSLPQADFLFWNSSYQYFQILNKIKATCKKISFNYSKELETYIAVYLTADNVYLFCYKNRDVYTISASSRNLSL